MDKALLYWLTELFSPHCIEIADLILFFMNDEIMHEMSKAVLFNFALTVSSIVNVTKRAMVKISMILKAPF